MFTLKILYTDSSSVFVEENTVCKDLKNDNTFPLDLK